LDSQARAERMPMQVATSTGVSLNNQNHHYNSPMDPHLSSSESFSASDPSKLTDSELDCLKEAFSLFDADHDGEITVHELGRVMRNHGLNPTDDELKDMIRNVDKNSNGAIDFNEFIEMMLRRDSKAGDDDVVHAFRVFDRDGDGLISAEELKLTMNNLGEPLTDDEVRSMIEAADLDGDGRINFDEFARLMQQDVFDGGIGSYDPSLYVTRTNEGYNL